MKRAAGKPKTGAGALSMGAPALKNERPDPHELMERAGRGDAAAFGELYRTYFTRVYRYVLLKVRNRADAEDLTHTVFLKVYESAPRFREMGKPPLAYFFTVAKNTIINVWRKKREVLFDDPVGELAKVASLDNPAATAEQNEAFAHAAATLETLTKDQREIITLKFMNELSNREIAAITGKSEDAIRQLQLRGLHTLRKHLNKYDEA